MPSTAPARRRGGRVRGLGITNYITAGRNSGLNGAHPPARSEPPAALTGLSSGSSLPSEVWKTTFQDKEKILPVRQLGSGCCGYTAPRLSGKREQADAFGLLSSD